jgi:hypothetical protein
VKQSFKKLMLFTVPFLLLSCGTMKIPDVSLPMLNGDYRELSNAPKDASLYQCEKNKKFYVRPIEGGKEMWLIFPDREFSLKQVDTSKNTYNNDTTTLEINDPETYIKEGEVLTYQKCRIQKLK